MQCNVCNYRRNSLTTREKLYTETDFRSLKSDGTENLLTRKKTLHVILWINLVIKFDVFHKKFRYKASLFQKAFFHFNYERVEETLTFKFETWKALVISKKKKKERKEKWTKKKKLKLKWTKANGVDYFHNPKRIDKPITRL